jgi:adenine-specific DNA-methyltransferase
MSNFLENQENFRAFLKQPYSRDQWRTIFPNLFSNVEIGINPPNLTLGWDSDFQSCSWIGKIKLDDLKGRPRTIWIIELQLKEHNRLMAKVALRKGLSKLLGVGSIDSVLAFFSSNEKNSNYRMTFASAEWDFIDGKLQKTETPFTRFSFVLGGTEPCTTASERIYQLFEKKGDTTFDDVVTAFSVDKLNKDFFEGYINQYKQILNAVAQRNCSSFFNQNIPESLNALIQDDAYKAVRSFVKRFMGRVVFLYFVQKKGWLGANKNQPNSVYENGNSAFIRELFDKFTSTNGYQPFQYLFFELLNTNRADFNDLCQLMDSKVPYLNSGLFEPEPIVDTKRIAALDQHKKIIISRSSIDDYLHFLDQFNFTVDENSPTEGDIGIDPEMLGHIFENLLEDNRNKGAFYTPKTIVEFMAKKALLTYLINSICPSIEEIEQLTNFVLGSPSIRPRPSLKLSKPLLKLLQKVKVCDPAVGSGAFPMGVLHEILWMLIDLGDERKSHEIKRDIISNSLRGVDLDGNAIEIARLRFWLTLIVDAAKPEPLPNLDFTLIQGNSLVGVGIGNDLDKLVATRRVGKERIKKVQDQLDLILASEPAEVDSEDVFNLLKDFYNAHGEPKKLLLEQIHNREASFLDDIKDEAKKLIFAEKRRSTSTMKDASKNIQLLEESLDRLETDSGEKGYFLWHWYFGDVLSNGGFDIMIGNPPYVKEFTHKKAFDGVRESPYYQGKMDLWYLFACSTLNHLRSPTGVLCFIATNNWTTNSGASLLRKTISTSCTINELVDFGSFKIFSGADIQTMIMLLSNHSTQLEYQFDLRRLTTPHPTEQDMLAVLLGTESPRAEYIRPTFNRELFLNKTFTFSNDTFSVLLDKIRLKANFILSPSTEIAQGIVTPQDSLNKKTASAIGGKAKVGDGVFILSQDEYKICNFTKEEKTLLKPFYTTKELNRYYGDRKNLFWIIYTDSSFKDLKKMSKYPNVKKHLDKYRSIITSDNKPYGLHRSRNESFFIGKKIISARKCDAPTFTLVDFDSYVSQTFNVIKSDRIDLGYLSALLNSSVVSFWLKKKGKMQGSNFQIDKEPIMEIPLYAPCNDVQACMSRLVSLVISLTHSNMLDVARLYDNVINLMIAQLYFEEEFANHDIDLISLILDSELKDLDPKDSARYHSKAIDFANETLLSPSKISEAVNDSFQISDINTIFNA